MEKVQSQELADLYWYWKSLHGDTKFPIRKLIEPANIWPKLLPTVFIVAVERDPLRFRFTLTGTGSLKLTNREIKGDYVSSAMGPNAQDAHDSFQYTVETERPNWGRARFPGVLLNRQDLLVEAIFLPFSVSGDQIDYVLGANALQIPPNQNLVIENGIFLRKRWKLELSPTTVEEAVLLPPSRTF